MVTAPQQYELRAEAQVGMAHPPHAPDTATLHRQGFSPRDPILSPSRAKAPLHQVTLVVASD